MFDFCLSDKKTHIEGSFGEERKCTLLVTQSMANMNYKETVRNNHQQKI